MINETINVKTRAGTNSMRTTTTTSDFEYWDIEGTIFPEALEITIAINDFFLQKVRFNLSYTCLM